MSKNKTAQQKRIQKKPLCSRCRKNEAIWALQYIPGNEGKPSVYALGWHIRGYKFDNICDECAGEIKRTLGTV